MLRDLTAEHNAARGRKDNVMSCARAEVNRLLARSSQNEVNVAEFVPEVTRLDRMCVRAFQSDLRQ